MKIGENTTSKEEERKSLAFHATGLFLYEFSQMEYLIRDLLRGVSLSAEEQIKTLLAPSQFSDLCELAQNSFIQRTPKLENEFKALFEKCRKLNDDRMTIVQGFYLNGSGNIPPQFTSPNTQQAHDYFMNPNKLVQLANMAKEISDKFMDDVLTYQNFGKEKP